MGSRYLSDRPSLGTSAKRNLKRPAVILDQALSSASNAIFVLVAALVLDAAIFANLTIAIASALIMTALVRVATIESTRSAGNVSDAMALANVTILAGTVSVCCIVMIQFIDSPQVLAVTLLAGTMVLPLAIYDCSRFLMLSTNRPVTPIIFDTLWIASAVASLALGAVSWRLIYVAWAAVTLPFSLYCLLRFRLSPRDFRPVALRSIDKFILVEATIEQAFTWTVLLFLSLVGGPSLVSIFVLLRTIFGISTVIGLGVSYIAASRPGSVRTYDRLALAGCAACFASAGLYLALVRMVDVPGLLADQEVLRLLVPGAFFYSSQLVFQIYRHAVRFEVGGRSLMLSRSVQMSTLLLLVLLASKLPISGGLAIATLSALQLAAAFVSRSKTVGELKRLAVSAERRAHNDQDCTSRRLLVTKHR